MEIKLNDYHKRVNAEMRVSVFPVSLVRFPASTWSTERGFVHVLCLYIRGLQETVCLLARRIIKL